MGGFAGQPTTDAIKKLKISFCGDAGNLNLEPLVTQTIQALLSSTVNSVNVVNARSVAKDRGIKVEKSVCDAENYATLIRVEVETDTKSRNLAGTIFNNSPRLVEIKGVRVESEFSDHMLYITNFDKPGAIALIGSVAAERGINIANMHMGRLSIGGDAVCLLEVSDPVQNEVLEQLKSSSLISDAKFVRLDD